MRNEVVTITAEDLLGAVNAPADGEPCGFPDERKTKPALHPFQFVVLNEIAVALNRGLFDDAGTLSNVYDMLARHNVLHVRMRYETGCDEAEGLE